VFPPTPSLLRALSYGSVRTGSRVPMCSPRARTHARTVAKTVPTVVPEPQFPATQKKSIIYSTAVRVKQPAPSFLGVGKVVSLARLKIKSKLHQITLRV
jgi:hypothetical protein